MYDLEGRILLLTGASRGIGAEAARAFAAEGVHLSLLARNGEELAKVAADCKEFRVGVMANICDVRAPEEVEWAVRNTVKEYGRIDLLINNAAELGELHRLPDTDPDSFVDTIDINLNGSYYFARECAREMRRVGGGRIMFVSSSVGRRPRPKWGAYAVSKRAVEGLMELMAAESERTGVLACSVNPGGTATEMRHKAFPDEDQTKLPGAEQVAETFLKIMQVDDAQFNGRTFDSREFMQNVAP